METIEILYKKEMREAKVVSVETSRRNAKKWKRPQQSDNLRNTNLFVC